MRGRENNPCQQRKRASRLGGGSRRVDLWIRLVVTLRGCEAVRLGRSQPLGTALSQLQRNTCTCNESSCLPWAQVSMLLRCCLPILPSLPPLSTPMAEGQWNQTRQFPQLYPTIWLLPEHLVIKVCWFHSRLYFRLSTRDWIVGPLLFVALNLFGQKGVLLFHYRSSCGSQASPCLHSPVLAREWMRPELGYPSYTSPHPVRNDTPHLWCVFFPWVFIWVRHETVLIVNAVECMPGDLFLILLSLWLIIILVSWKLKKKTPYTRFISAQSFQQ